MNQRDLGRPVPFAKIFPFPADPNHFYIRSRPVPLEGRIAIVTDVGTGCGGRGRRCRRERFPRTAKSCGPDASTPASSWRETISPMTVTRKPDHRGEHEGNR